MVLVGEKKKGWGGEKDFWTTPTGKLQKSYKENTKKTGKKKKTYIFVAQAWKRKESEIQAELKLQFV